MPPAEHDNVETTCARCHQVSSVTGNIVDSITACGDGCDALLCRACACDLIGPALRRRDVSADPYDTGLEYTCPACKRPCRLTHVHVLALMKGSWVAAFSEFPCMQAIQAWSANRLRTPGNRTSPVRTRSHSAVRTRSHSA